MGEAPDVAEGQLKTSRADRRWRSRVSAGGLTAASAAPLEEGIDFVSTAIYGASMMYYYN